MFRRLCITLFTLMWVQNSVAQSAGSISGIILDRDTKQPLVGANVMLEDSPYGSATDGEGRFVMQNIPVGTYRLRADMIGYKSQARANIHIASQRTIEVTLELIPTVLAGEDVTVTAGFFERARDAVVSVRSVDIEEIRSDPVGAYDVMRMMQALPAVVSGADQDNEIIIRGGNPGENLFIMDHLEIPYPNHFSQAGSGGGPITLINTEFIERIDFYAGSFPARYGGKVSSVMDVSLREGNRQHHKGQFNFNMAGFGLTFEGPLNDKTNYIATLKRSFLDFVIANTGLAAVPQYWTGQAKVTYHLKPGEKIMFNFLGGIDGIDIVGEDTPQARGAENVDFATRQYTLGVTYKRLIKNRGYWITSMSQNMIRVETDVYRVEADATHNTYFTQADMELDHALKSDVFYKFSPKFELSGGIKVSATHLDYDQNYQGSPVVNYIYRFDNQYWGDPAVRASWNGETVQPFDNAFYYAALDTLSESNILQDTLAVGTDGTWQSNLDMVSPSVWVQTRFYLFREMELILGGRVGQTGYTNYRYFSPRIGLSYPLTRELKVNLSGGRYYQRPFNVVLNGDYLETDELKNYYADQIVLGTEYLPREDVRLTLEIYEKRFDQMVTSAWKDSIVNGRNVIYFDNEHQVNAGSGYSRGIEFFIQKKFVDNWYGSFSYSKSIARGIDPRDNKTEYPWTYDYGDVMTLIGGYKIQYMNYDWYPRYKTSLIAKAFSWLPFMPSDEYELSFRARYVGGRPYTERMYNPYRRRWYIPANTPLNTQRYDAYFRFDVMLLQRFYFEKMNLVAFWDIMNVTNRDNPWEYIYKADGSREMSWQFKTFPVGGVTLEF